ncbi:hypothetical protein, partial [Enterococcus durans]|uniref:hypothetical protein n=1 Tax=Enterococcus durans TaxID=53345 RepID=UPI0039A50840
MNNLICMSNLGMEQKGNNILKNINLGSILFDVGELRQHLFCIKKYRKDTLKSFRINLPNKFIGGFKMSHTQLIKDTLNILDLNIHFEENCLTKEKYKGQ